jgi:CheY-like chemotaxis protein
VFGRERFFEGPQAGRETDGRPHPGPTSAQPARMPLTVLYIEDNPSNFTLVEHIFAFDPQVELVPASSGREGVERARALRPGLILLDVHLPDATGEEVLGQLRSDPETEAIPVAGITADARKLQRERLLAAGADEFFTKPIMISRLREFVARVRDERNGA